MHSRTQTIEISTSSHPIDIDVVDVVDVDALSQSDETETFNEPKTTDLSFLVCAQGENPENSVDESVKEHLGKTYYKIMDVSMNNRGFQYVIGENKLNESFVKDGWCSGGGLYFCKLENVVEWMGLYDYGLICEVSVPATAKVIVHSINGVAVKYKTDVLVVSNPLPYHEFIQKHNLQLAAVNYDPNNLCYVDDQTESLCCIAVQKEPDSLRHVKKQTDVICFAAVQKNGYTIRHVIHKTKDICAAAIKQNNNVEYLCRDFMESTKLTQTQTNNHYFGMLMISSILVIAMSAKYAYRQIMVNYK